jgi:hypothetical protein
MAKDWNRLLAKWRYSEFGYLSTDCEILLVGAGFA